MKSWLSRLTAGLKVKRLPRSEVDCADFIARRPEAPLLERLREAIVARHFAGRPSDDRAGDPTTVAEQREQFVRAIAFDLRYRCGGQGRCVENDYRCRFPCCFQIRPVTKGAEIQAERAAYEVADAPTPETRAIVALAREERLVEAVQKIQELADREIRAGARGRQLAPELLSASASGDECGTQPGLSKYGDNGLHEGCNPLLTEAALREEVLALYLWRAALLVNLRQDAAAVHSLLNLASLVPEQDRMRLYGAAAAWAALNDMEIVYYRSLVQQYASFPVAESFASERPMLLRRVLEACSYSSYFVEYATHIVFSKEVTATVSRAQAAQMHGDLTEDPMHSLVLPLALRYYRFYVSNDFWQHFLSLLLMPPIAPLTVSERQQQSLDPISELGLTPNHVLDAIGRSMLLHHLVLYANTREREIESGAIAADTAKHSDTAACGTSPHPADYERVLEPRELAIAVGRMRELLNVVKTHEQAPPTSPVVPPAPPSAGGEHS